MTDNIPTWNEFSNFLQQRCTMLESMSYTSQLSNRDESKSTSKQAKVHNRNKYSNAAASQDLSCPCCKGSCNSVASCDKFNKLPVDERFLLVRREGLCARCLLRKPHPNCLSNQCDKCQRTHHTLVHFDDPKLFQAAWKQSNTNMKPAQQVNSIQIEDVEDLDYDEDMIADLEFPQRLVNAAKIQNFSTSYTWLATTLIKVKNNENQLITIRALLDAGSQISIISSETYKMLGLEAQATVLRLVGVNGDINVINKAVNLEISSRHGSYHTNILAAVHNHLNQQHPACSTPVTKWKIPGRINLADPEFFKPRSIDMILGADVFYKILGGKRMKVGNGQPDLIQTQFGWVVAGPMELTPVTTACTLTSYLSASANETCHMDLEWMKTCWELESVPTVQVAYSPEEQRCLDHFKSTIRFDKGKYTVKLPFTAPASKLGQSRDIAMARLLNVQRKMNRDEKYKHLYEAFMDEYEQLGHMEETTPPDPTTPHYYIPHFAVWNLDSSTTKLRVVFNASCATTTGVSLNDILMVGPILQSDLFTHLLKIRTQRYMIAGDITKMYRQIGIDDDDKQFLLVLWCRPGEATIRTFRLNTVTYGTAPAPFQATACVVDLANRFNDLPIGSATLRESFYVDDMMSGANTIEETLEIYHQTTTLLSRGGFKLRKFQSNSSEVMDHIPENEHGTTIQVGSSEVIKTLGLNWDPIPDVFTFYYEVSTENTCTKRSILSQASRHFDPLGLSQPITVRSKLFVQHLWACKKGWDEPISESLHNSWKEIRQELAKVSEISVPRYIFTDTEKVDVQIHGFSDASTSAYAAALYVRTVGTDNKVNVKLWCAKTKLAPLKTISISRLELCGALLLATLLDAVLKRVPLEHSAIHLWTDSLITLVWITTSPHLREIFVANRVTKIQELTTGCHWHHIPGDLNPADIASRGATMKKLKATPSWFDGPNFVYEDEVKWPEPPQFPLEVPDTKPIKCNFEAQADDDLVMRVKFESWPQTRRTLGYVGRFLLKLAAKLRSSHSLVTFLKKLPPNTTEHDEMHDITTNNGKIAMKILTVAELQIGEMLGVKIVQHTGFAYELKILQKNQVLPRHHPLVCLTPFLDENGYIRVGGRLSKCVELSYNQKHQLLLPGTHPYTIKLFSWVHKKTLHGGPKAMMTAVQQKYWVPRGKVVANRTFNRCTICFRAKPVTYQEVMGQMPSTRTKIVTKPFTNCGIDFCGPFYIHNKGRGARPTNMYLAIFVCFSTKAVHLELVEDLSTEAFINTLKRFIGRRGVPATIWSDNATNFKGSARLIGELGKLLQRNDHWVQVYEWCRDYAGITWKFIPPRTPHFGGLWEAAVKSAKQHLVKTASTAPLLRDEMDTLIVMVEATLNNRLLLPLVTNPIDGNPLTPAHFLIGSPLDELPEPDLADNNPDLLKRYQRIIAMKQLFWKRWSREYLATLQNTYKWQYKKNGPQLDDVVLVIDRNLKSQQWQLGRIVKMYPDGTGVVRVVDVKTINGIFKRGISELCPLPISKED